MKIIILFIREVFTGTTIEEALFTSDIALKFEAKGVSCSRTFGVEILLQLHFSHVLPNVSNYDELFCTSWTFFEQHLRYKSFFRRRLKI